MPINTLDLALAGMQPLQLLVKTLPAAAQRPLSTWPLAGIPGAGGYNGTAAGAAYSSTGGLVAGQIPHYDPAGGLFSYIARLSATGGTTAPQYGSVYLCDRLWDNSGLSITTTTAQTVNSATWPARDVNGNTTGIGVYIGLEFSVASGGGNGNISYSYTNTLGTGGQSATVIDFSPGVIPIGGFLRLGLAAGDRGVQSIQTLTLSASMVSGTFGLVAYRVIAACDWSTQQGISKSVDLLTGGFQRVYNGTVPFVLVCDAGLTPVFSLGYTESQG
jgi:hypothetical protein